MVLRRMDAHGFLVALTIVLGVAAVTTVVFQRLRQPVVLGYILAGLRRSARTCRSRSSPIARSSQTLSELGVILLMFSLGLEFSLGKLLQARAHRGAHRAAAVEPDGLARLRDRAAASAGRTLESLFAGAIIAISSTTIIAKAFDEQGVHGPLRELVVGVLIVEDLIAILLMATLTAIASGAGLSAREIAATTGQLALFLVGLIGGRPAAGAARRAR